MENISSDKIIENEINSFIDIALHLDSYLLRGKIGLVNLNNKIKKYKLSQNSIDLLNQMISSEKVSNYFCYNNNIKEIRNKLGIMKAIKEVFKQESEKEEEEKVIRKINPYSFNQFSLANKQSFFSSEAEFYFLKNFIHGKLLKIIKACFEKEFNKKNEPHKNNNYNHANHPKNKKNFILISHSCIKNARIMKEYIENNQKLSLSNNYIKVSNSKILNPINFKYFKNNLAKSEINIFDNSKGFKSQKNPRNVSYINSTNFNLNKNSTSSCNKSSNRAMDYNAIISTNKNEKENKIYIRKNAHLLNKRKKYSQDKDIFFPLLGIQYNKIREIPNLKGKNIPSIYSDKIELISYNTKNNIKVKNEQIFLNECIKESIRCLRNIKDLNRSKCFVDYSKSSIMSDKLDNRKKEEPPTKEKMIFPGFEYKSVYRYNFNGKLTKNKKKFML